MYVCKLSDLFIGLYQAYSKRSRAVETQMNTYMFAVEKQEKETIK